MRRRSTFILGVNQNFDPSEVQLKERKFLYPGLKGAREERLTYTIEELPTTIVDVLRSLQSIHIRWTPEISQGSRVPFPSRSTPGLHVLITPLQQTADDLVCVFLREVFSPELRCHSVQTSFSEPGLLPATSTSTTTLQYYSLLSSLNHFVAYIQRNVCKQSNQRCSHDAALLNIVDYLDLDYDSQTRKLILTAFWSKEPPAIYDPIGELTTLEQWPIVIEAAPNDKVEVGILTSSPSTDPHELQLGGFITVIGESDKPKRTQFSFPSRHHILSRTQATKQGYTVSFQKPTGLHPILEINFPSFLSLEPPTNKPADSVCSLHSYFTLPSSVFADEYAFTAKDPLFEQSHNLRSIRSISGELDLEAPDYVIQQWGSAMLLELATPPLNATPIPDKAWTVTVPLHLRYLPPADGGLDKIRMPWPVIFWACTAEEGIKFHKNPFDRVDLGYDSLFDTNTMFYHLKPAPRAENENRLVEEIPVPVLSTSWFGGDLPIEQGTLVVILLGFGWVLLKLWPGLGQQLGLGRTSNNVSKSSVEKKSK